MKLLSALFASLVLLVLTAAPVAAASDYSFFFSTAPTMNMGIPAYSDYFNPLPFSRFGNAGMFGGYPNMGMGLGLPQYAPTLPFQTYSGMNMNFPLMPMPLLGGSSFGGYGSGFGSGYYAGAPVMPNLYNGNSSFANPFSNGFNIGSLGNIGGYQGYGNGFGLGSSASAGAEFGNGYGGAYSNAYANSYMNGYGCSAYVSCSCNCTR
jgi:hypothetical protein